MLSNFSGDTTFSTATRKDLLRNTASMFSFLTFLTFNCISIPAQAMDRYDTQRVNDAVQLCDSGHFPEAIRILTGVNQRNPKDSFVLCQLGHAHMNNAADLTHSTAIAEKCFRKAIEVDPQYGRAYKKLSEWYSAHGNWQMAAKLATQALTVKRPDISALVERAGAYSSLHRDKEALADFELFTSKTRLPTDRRHREKIYLQKAGLLENLKQYDKALTVYRTIQKEHYEDSIVFREVACLKAMKRPDEALKCLNQLIAHNKFDDTGYLNRARLYESLGKHKEAVTDYSTSIELSPSATALKERANVYDKIGRKDLADKDRKDAERI